MKNIIYFIFCKLPISNSINIGLIDQQFFIHANWNLRYKSVWSIFSTNIISFLYTTVWVYNFYDFFPFLFDEWMLLLSLKMENNLLFSGKTHTSFHVRKQLLSILHFNVECIFLKINCLLLSVKKLYAI